MAIIRTQNRAQPAFVFKLNPVFDRPILVVEDQKSVAEYTATVFNDTWGCNVLIANSLQQAEQLLASTTPPIQVAICDLNLPDAPYGEVIDLMNERGVASIALTGSFGEDLRESMQKKGVVDYIPKQSVNAYEYVTALAGRIQKNHHATVLVVDDALSARALYKHMFELLRFKVLTANNGKEALDILHQFPEVSLMLTDYSMPEMDGFELTAKARATFTKDKLVIIGISASSGEDISSSFLKCGANDYLAKPFSYQEFLCRIHQNLDMLDLIKVNRDAAQRDFLTGLFNRRYFFATASQFYTKAVIKSPPLVAAMIDLDYFKKINDTYGHDCGDLVLRHFAALLDQYLGKYLVARLGGEEFGILMNGTPLDEAYTLLEQLRKAVKNEVVDCGTSKISYTVSIGLSDRASESIDELLKVADLALYKAKDNHRDQVCCLS